MHESLLERWQALETKRPGPVPYSLAFADPSFAPLPHLVVTAAVHGNEVGSLPALLELAQTWSQSPPKDARVTLILGNPEAVRRGARFLEEDLNRAFGRAADAVLSSAEAKRARALEPLLAQAQLHLDFHQTLQPCAEPFYTFSAHRESLLWARALGGARLLATRMDGAAFSRSGQCADEYSRSLGIPAVTLELGQAGVREDANEVTRAVSLRALRLLARNGQALPLPPPQDAVRRMRLLDAFILASSVPFAAAGDALRPGLKNWEAVRKGEDMGNRENGVPLRAEIDGRILFPKYPARGADGRALPPYPGELVRIVAPPSGKAFRKLLRGAARAG